MSKSSRTLSDTNNIFPPNVLYLLISILNDHMLQTLIEALLNMCMRGCVCFCVCVCVFECVVCVCVDPLTPKLSMWTESWVLLTVGMQQS